MVAVIMLPVIEAQTRHSLKVFLQLGAREDAQIPVLQGLKVVLVICLRGAEELDVATLDLPVLQGVQRILSLLRAAEHHVGLQRTIAQQMHSVQEPQPRQ